MPRHVFLLGSLDLTIVAAPMAGGPTTPALVVAVSETGGLGFLAGGYEDAQSVEAEIAAVRSASACPFGVNLFFRTMSDRAPNRAVSAE